MALAYGTVLVFKDGITEEQADAALATLAKAGLLSDNFLSYPYDPEGRPNYHSVPVRVPYRLERFDTAQGGPVWYLP